MTITGISERTPDLGNGTSLMGLARLMRMAFAGLDLRPLATGLIARASAAQDDADALMDLSTILLLQGIRDVGLATQAQALGIKRVYELPAGGTPLIRLLAIVAPGDLMTNTPLPFLVEDSNVTLSMLYILPGEALPSALPEHDLLFVAISESDQTRALLEQLEAGLSAWSTPVRNRPGRILRTGRSEAYKLLADAHGICMPATARLTRDELRLLSSGRTALDSVLAEGVFPLIVRPVGSHAGLGLAQVEGLEDISSYLQKTAGDEFFISRFIDYHGDDGLFRKYRVVLIERRAYAGHMGVSSHWMIHYLNAGMTESAEKRAEEERFMRNFDADFGRRHADAFATIADRFGLDYLVIDCAEAASGELLVFEVDPGAVIHSMDPAELFPYKYPQMKRVFTEFRAMLLRSTAPVTAAWSSAALPCAPAVCSSR